MKRRTVCLAVTFVCASLVGCEWLQYELRPKSHEKPYELYDDESHTEKDESIAPKGFHKATRLPGALSDEAREIESHLGIH
jgi:hypothetical protein